MESNTQPRDYDKDPIVIEDYNPLFGWLETLYVIFPMFIMVFLLNPFDVNRDSMISKVLLMTPFALLPMYREYKMAKNHRKVFLKNDEMVYRHDEKVVTVININTIKNIHRTFDDLYHSSQILNEFYKFVLIILFPFVIIWKIGLLLMKFCRYVLNNKKLNGYKLFDSVIIENFNGDILTISPQNTKERELLLEYLKIKNIDLVQLPIRYSVFYSFEKINLDK